MGNVRETLLAGQAVDRRGPGRVGDGDVWGDGLVPVASALLRGSQQLTLDGVSHFTGFGGPWYGAIEVIPQWWNVCTSKDESKDKDTAIPHRRQC